jgi:hypothetical protein
LKPKVTQTVSSKTGSKTTPKIKRKTKPKPSPNFEGGKKKKKKTKPNQTKIDWGHLNRHMNG